MSSRPPRPDTVVILAAGQGTRMKSALPKVLHEVCGRPLLAYVVDQALGLEPKRLLVVVGHGADQVRAALIEEGFGDRVTCVLQDPQSGTGHALQVCLPELGADPGRTVVLYGDMPLVRIETLRALVAAQDAARKPSGEPGAALLTATPADPRAFGRILRDANGDVRGIVEERDATPEERAIREVNLGVYVFPGLELVELLPRLANDNAQGEYYLTDIAAGLRARGGRVVALTLADESEAVGVNTLRHLADARRALQERILDEHLANGVQIEDPATTFVDWGVTIGVGTRILPCTVIRRGVTIGAHCEVGPFTHLRKGTVLADHAEVGNFTECKQSTIGEHTKAKHLSYLGDTTVGAHVNIGAGTIFANYDGRDKHPSFVGDHAFVGSGTLFVAPGSIGAGATTGAGAVVTKNVPPGETWVGVPAKQLAPAKPFAKGSAAEAEEED